MKTEKQQTEQQVELYEAPKIEVIDIKVEQTFLQTASGTPGQNMPGEDWS